LGTRRRIWKIWKNKMKKDLGCLSKEAYGNAVLSSIEFPEDAATPLHRGKFPSDSGTVFFVGISHEVSSTEFDD
jgi:hypothetical protein